MQNKPIERILLGVTGGVAAYKAAEWVRLAQKAGLQVRVVMSEAATRFVGPETFQALTAEAVYTDAWDDRIANRMPHIELTRWADVMLVAPATADFIARAAAGLANDLVTTCAVSRDCPLWVAPAMNREMWDHPATQRNIETLRKDGVRILGPAAGEQACGEVGVGRLLEPAEILEALLSQNKPVGSLGALAGREVLVTAGPTFEPIDPVRGLTNSSSGKMGYAVARALVDAGASVTLVSGPVALPCPVGVTRINIRTADEMYTAVMQRAPESDLFFAVAAVADYTPVDAAPEKLKKNGEALTLTLRPTPDILKAVAALPDPPFCVGFAAETERIEEHAREKRLKKNIPVIVANSAREAIGADVNTLMVIDDTGTETLGPDSKERVAAALVQRVIALYTRSLTHKG